MGATFAHVLLLGRPGGQRMHVFWKSASVLDFSVKSDVEESRNGCRCWLMVEVGGRGGASGGRGRLRLRSSNGLVSLSSTPCYLLTRCGGSTSPAASTRPRAVCMCFCCTLGLYLMRSCLVVLVGTYRCLCGTLRGLLVSLWHFGWS